MRSAARAGLAWAMLGLACAGPAAPAAPVVVEVSSASPVAAPPVAASSAELYVEEPRPKPSTSEPRPLGGFTCSMHPHVQQPREGTCPICGMDMIEARDR